MTISSGIPRLDDLLKGGIKDNSNVLVYGAPFTGKQLLLYRFSLKALADGIPVIIISTDKTASDCRMELLAQDKKVEEYEKNNLIYYIDIYSVSIGSEERIHNAEYVDSPVNLNAIALALNNAQDEIVKNHKTHRIAFSSLSTLITYTNPVTTFRFTQILSGKCKRLNATSLYTLEEGMHGEMEIQMFKHLMDGVIELKENDKDLKTYIHVQGLGDVMTRDWVEYKNTGREIDIIGSFSTGRIR